MPTFFASVLATSYYIHKPSLVAKISVVQKKQTGWQTFNQVLNHHCDLDLEHSTPVFSPQTLAYGDVPTN